MGWLDFYVSHYSCLMFLPSHNVCSNLQPYLSIMFVLVQVSNHKFSKFPHNTLHSYFSTTSTFFKRLNLESSFEDLRWLRIDCVFFKMYAFDLDMFFYFLFIFIEISKIEAPRYTGHIQLGYYGMTRFLCFSLFMFDVSSIPQCMLKFATLLVYNVCLGPSIKP